MGLRCNGITKNGGQCKITGTFENGYCHLHKDQYPPTIPNDSIDSSGSTNSEIPPPHQNQKLSDNSNDKTPGCFSKILLITSIIIIIIGIFSIITKKH